MIDITEIKMTENAVMPVDFTGSFQLHASSDIPALVVKGTLTNEEENGEHVIVLRARVFAEVNSCCDRCLCKVSYKLDYPMEEIFVRKETDGAWLYEGNVIDLMPAIIGSLTMQMPMKTLCKEDCKGLCPSCGADLNKIEKCPCPSEYVNPAFDVLRSLFSENEEV